MYANHRFIANKPSVLFWLLFCLLQIVSLLAFIFVVGFSKESKMVGSSYVDSVCSYHITFDFPERFETVSVKVEELFNDDKLDISDIAFNLDEERNVYTFFSRKMSRKVTYGRPVANKSDIVVDSFVADPSKIGSSIIWNERSFSICGIFLCTPDETGIWEIPFSAVRSSDLVYSLTFRLRKMPTEKTSSDFTRLLQNCFSSAIVEKPQERDIASEYGITVESVLFICVTLLVFVNLTYLYVYWLHQNKNAIAICRICGCSRRQLGQFIFFCFAIQICISVAISVLLWYFLKPLLLFDNVFTWEDVFFPVLAYMVMAIIVVVFQIVRFFKRPMISFLM